VASVHQAITTILPASNATAILMAVLPMFVMPIEELVFVNQTSVDHAVIDVQQDSTDIHCAFLVAAAKPECK